MTSLFRNLIKESSRETAIKEILLNTLGENAREIQFNCKENGTDCLELTDSTNSLCTTIEAIFLHGLKDSLLWQTINVISGDNADRRPEPSFWPVLLVFLHKQVIEHINSLSQIISEIGYCRSWIRLSLNESLLSSYLNTIKKNSSALNPYYKKYAILRDSDNLDVASKILEGVEACVQINLPINSSLLNHWTNLSLQLAGIWSPPLKSCPIASGVDIANSITTSVEIPTPKPLQTNELFSNSISNSPFQTTSVLLSNEAANNEGDDKNGAAKKIINNNNEHSDDDSIIVLNQNLLGRKSSDLSESENIKILLQKVDEIGKIPKDKQENKQDDKQGKNEVINEKIDQQKPDDVEADSEEEDIESKTKRLFRIRSKGSKSKKKSKNSTVDLSQIQIAGNSVTNLSGWSVHEKSNNDDNIEQQCNNNNNTNNDNFDPNCTNEMSSSMMTESTISECENQSKASDEFVSRSNSSVKSPSYNTLLRRHEKSRELNWNDIWVQFERSICVAGDTVLSKPIRKESLTSSSSSLNGDTSTICNDNNNENVDEIEIHKENLSFEILPQTLSEKFTLRELQSMVEQMFKLAREKGLDSQGYICKSCPHPLGVGFAPAQVCSFSGNYYCASCIYDEELLIPAKVVYNWDFHKYKVSKKSALFLQEFQNQPFIEFKLLNPNIYMASDNMAQLQSLRIKLNFIRAYLFTCRESIIDELQRQVWPKEYLYEHIHKYSIADLQMIQKGTLQQLLTKTVQFGENHILNCRLCSMKGFICEICNSPKVLYPFHIDTTFRCELCGAVFHANCLNDSQPCPKCERRKKREDLPLLEAVEAIELL